MGMTGYINKRLRRTNETLVYRAHLAWMPVILRATPFLLLTSIASGIMSGISKNLNITLVTMGIGLLVTFVLSLPRIMKNLGTDIVVTDRRLHTKTGIIDINNDHETPLTNINDTIVDPTVFGRVLGYGDVIIRTYGNDPDHNDGFSFRGVVDPYELMAVISETRDSLLAHGAPTPWGRDQGSQQGHGNAGSRGNRQGNSWSGGWDDGHGKRPSADDDPWGSPQPRGNGNDHHRDGGWY